MAAKKKAPQPARPARLKEGGRWSTSYGPEKSVGNPGAGVTKRTKSTSDYIRPPMKKSGKKK
jgi:hypothetical protein